MTAANAAPASVLLPDREGNPELVRLGPPAAWPRPSRPLASRSVYAAAHVIPRTWADTTPGAPGDLDWDATLAYRHEIWSYGLGVADAMDTAQRGMGLDWAATRQLIVRSAAAAKYAGGALVCGAGTDQLADSAPPSGSAGLDRVADAYREQIAVVREAGAGVVLMASRALARVATSANDYLRVYGRLLDEVDQPVILHWLGEMFDPALAGYWGSPDVSTATSTVVELINSHADKVAGIKVSLLDAAHETTLRRRLPAGVRLYTGDDFNYPELIVGDGTHHSDALLGIFAATYPAASAAVQALDAGDSEQARKILDSTQALSRTIFAAPTRYYKTGIAFVSWLNGHQPGFTMLDGLHGARPLAHLVEVFRQTDQAGLLCDPELAAHRMRTLLAVHGWPA
ncbi:MAG TPA: dihydrodipicolinate synthase family protein [Actinocrinis sp.]|uniref:dihydrodipicolinate synthase family protein n=1 Tax=Actinocrinis sp. TaxID=1920516 RepID=UPI002DDD8357|nr:dihydrodipicolinate synthase family protein [Actinocrinis sp.]HEV3172516.1 dihydrodipicolinate synthase family protein [Actinocrinis sp.]